MFVSINLPEAWKSALATAIQKGKRDLPLRWAEAAQAHLTLAFLGEVGEGQLRAVKTVIQEAVQGRGKIILTLGSPGVFPRESNPNVFWVEASSPEGQLALLAETIQEKLAEAGLPCDRKKFKSHITVARAPARENRGQKGRTLTEQFCTLFRNIETETFSVDGVDLMRSHLTPSGARHEKIASFTLGTF